MGTFNFPSPQFFLNGQRTSLKVGDALHIHATNHAIRFCREGKEMTQGHGMPVLHLVSANSSDTRAPLDGYSARQIAWVVLDNAGLTSPFRFIIPSQEEEEYIFTIQATSVVIRSFYEAHRTLLVPQANFEALVAKEPKDTHALLRASFYGHMNYALIHFPRLIEDPFAPFEEPRMNLHHLAHLNAFDERIARHEKHRIAQASYHALERELHATIHASKAHST